MSNIYFSVHGGALNCINNSLQDIRSQKFTVDKKAGGFVFAVGEQMDISTYDRKAHDFPLTGTTLSSATATSNFLSKQITLNVNVKSRK